MAHTRKPANPAETEALDKWRTGYPVIAMRALREAGYSPEQRAVFLRNVAGCGPEHVADFASDAYLEPQDNNRFLYIYATGRDDGFGYAVGEYNDEQGPANGSLALFQRAQDAHTFAYAVQASEGAMVHVLPSAELETD